MTGLCGARHHQHPDTVCTDPPGHYRRDRDSHAGPLIIDGRQCGAAAWDEPKENPMPDQQPARQRVNALYEQWLTAGPPPLGTPIARWWDRHLVELREAILDDQAAAAADGDRRTVGRVEALAYRWETAAPSDLPYARSLRLALTGPTEEPAAPIIDRPFRSHRTPDHDQPREH